MSVVPPLLALCGFGGLPSLVTSSFPVTTALTGLAGAVFFAYSPQVVRVVHTDKYDNANPRAQLEAQSRGNSSIARAQAAHSNGLETFPLFAAGVLSCVATGADKTEMGQLISVYLLARGAFNGFYLFAPGIHVARSASWMLGQLAAFGLLGLGLANY